MWEVLNGIFYILVEGVRWRALPGDFPPWHGGFDREPFMQWVMNFCALDCAGGSATTRNAQALCCSKNVG
ncbi:transposase [Scytonema sp. NUACC26]|uniref:transposase n=1 Tax=Scytonema sp. NUACC26 TaxID=3140176 RepID=UPI0038B353F0